MKSLLLTVPVLFSAYRILESADCILQFAGSLFGLAFSFELFVAEDLTGGFFHRTLGLLCGTFDSIFIHCRILGVSSGSRTTASSTYCS
jgi:hypothetical protein